jgi:hypothetical protein
MSFWTHGTGRRYFTKVTAVDWVGLLELRERVMRHIRRALSSAGEVPTYMSSYFSLLLPLSAADVLSIAQHEASKAFLTVVNSVPLPPALTAERLALADRKLRIAFVGSELYEQVIG